MSHSLPIEPASHTAPNQNPLHWAARGRLEGRGLVPPGERAKVPTEKEVVSQRIQRGTKALKQKILAGFAAKQTSKQRESERNKRDKREKREKREQREQRAQREQREKREIPSPTEIVLKDNPPTMDGRNPAPPKKPRDDASPVNSNKRYGFPWFRIPSTVPPRSWQCM